MFSSYSAAAGPKSTVPMWLPPPAWPPIIIEQVLSGTGGFISGVSFEADVVAQRAALKDVVPGGDGERGDLDVLEVFFDGPLLPVVVVVSVGGPVEEIGRERLSEFCARMRLGDVEDGKLREGQDVDRVRALVSRRMARLSVSCARPSVHDSLNHCSNAPPW